MSSDFGFGGMFDPEELQKAMSNFAEQAQKGQQVAFADAAIQLAVQMTVAAVGRITPAGTVQSGYEITARTATTVSVRLAAGESGRGLRAPPESGWDLL